MLSTSCSSSLGEKDYGPLLDLDVRDSWSAPAHSGAVSGDAFWETFGDSKLEELVQEALNHNRDLMASAARLRAAAARAGIARAVRGPNVDATGGRVRSKNIFVGLPIPGGANVLESTSTTWDAGLTAEWEIDLWGRLQAGVDAAKSDLAASLADLAGARLSIAAQTARAWFAVREARQQVELAERTKASYEESSRVIQERFEAGLSGALDLRLARANVDGSEARLVVAERAYGVARRSIEILLGRYPEAELAALDDFPSLPPPVPAGLPVELVGRRPDLVAVERRVDAAEAAARQLRLDRWPKLFITGDGGTTSDQFEDLLDGDFSVWRLGIRLTAPLFDGGRRRAQVDEAEALVYEARAVFAGSVLQALFEVENALEAERLLQQELGHLTDATAESREALSLAEDQYREGIAGIDIVLESQRRLLTAESEFLSARRDLFENRVDLHVALGGSFDALRPPEDADREDGGPGNGGSSE